MKQQILVIVGPTASGKSALAVKLAKKLNGEVISADSRQVYEGLDIGSGKITRKEMRGVPHHLLDVASPKRVFTVARYQKLARQKIKEIITRGKLPIICGGTGFYIQSIVDDLVLPAVKPDRKLRAQFGQKKPEELFKILKRIDPARVKNIDKNNPRRLIRAIEIARILGKVPKLVNKPQHKNVVIIGLNPPAERLKKLTRKRLEQRMKNGLIEEVAKLRKNGLSWKRLNELGLEYRHVALYLQQKISREEMTLALSGAIWHYAKRQLTWFKRDPRIKWCVETKQAERLALK